MWWDYLFVWIVCYCIIVRNRIMIVFLTLLLFWMLYEALQIRLLEVFVWSVRLHSFVGQLWYVTHIIHIYNYSHHTNMFTIQNTTYGNPNNISFTNHTFITNAYQFHNAITSLTHNHINSWLMQCIETDTTTLCMRYQSNHNTSPVPRELLESSLVT